MGCILEGGQLNARAKNVLVMGVKDTHAYANRDRKGSKATYHSDLDSSRTPVLPATGK